MTSRFAFRASLLCKCCTIAVVLMHLLSGGSSWVKAQGIRTLGGLSRPNGLIIDANTNLYVADTNNNRIVKLTSNGTVIQIFKTSDPSFNNPAGLAFDLSGYIYVTDRGNNRIVKLNPNSSQILVFYSNTSLSNAAQIAIDSGNNLYVAIADPSNGRILKLASNGSLIQTFTTANPALFRPSGVAVDSLFNVYIADTYNFRIVKFAANGSIIAIFNNPYRMTPSSLLIDELGNIYTSTDDQQLIKLGPTGNVIWQAPILILTPTMIPTSQIGAFSNGLAISTSSQILYCSNVFAGLISTFSDTGIMTGNITTDPLFKNPSTVSVDLSYNVYVGNGYTNQIYKININGTRTAVYGLPGPNYATGMTVDALQNVYLSDQSNNRVIKFAPDGTLLLVFIITNPHPDNPSMIPGSLVIDSQSNLYVDDFGGRIVKFDPQGSQIGSLPSCIINGGCVLAMDRLDYLYAASGGNIDKFDSQGNFNMSFTVSQSLYPYTGFSAIAVDSSMYLYASDVETGLIFKFDPSGIQVSTLSTGNTLINPNGLAIDLFNNVYITDPVSNKFITLFFEPCPSGSYCPTNSFSVAICPAGYYCPLQYLYSNLVIPCPGGYYCPLGTVTPINCTSPFYCPLMSSSPISCPASYYCPNRSASPNPCPISTYCPYNISAPITCPIGFYCPALVSSAITCPPSTLCDTNGQSHPKLCPYNIDCNLTIEGNVSTSLNLWQNSLQLIPFATFGFCYSIFDTSGQGSSVTVKGQLSTTQRWNATSGYNLPILSFTAITGLRTYSTANGSIVQNVGITGLGSSSIQSIFPDNGVLSEVPYLTSNGLEYTALQPMASYDSLQIQIYSVANFSYRERSGSVVPTGTQPSSPYQSAFGLNYSVILPNFTSPIAVCPILTPQIYYFCYYFSSPSSTYGAYNVTASGILLTVSNGSSIAMIDATGFHLLIQNLPGAPLVVDSTTIIGIQRSLPPTITSAYAEQFIHLTSTLPVDLTGISFTLNTPTLYPNSDSYAAVRIASSNGLLYETYRSDNALSFGSTSAATQYFGVYQYSPYVNQGYMASCGSLPTQLPPRALTGSVVPFNSTLTRVGQPSLTVVTGSGTLPLSNQVYFQFIQLNTSTPILGLGIRLNDPNQNTTLKLAIYNASSLFGTSQSMVLIQETMSFTVQPQYLESVVVELPLASTIILDSGIYAIAVTGFSVSQTIAYVCCRSSLASLTPAEALQSTIVNNYQYGFSGYNASGLGIVTTAQLQNLGLDNLQLPMWMITQSPIGAVPSSSSTVVIASSSSTGSPTTISSSAFSSATSSTTVSTTGTLSSSAITSTIGALSSSTTTSPTGTLSSSTTAPPTGALGSSTITSSTNALSPSTTASSTGTLGSSTITSSTNALGPPTTASSTGASGCSTVSSSTTGSGFSTVQPSSVGPTSSIQIPASSTALGVTSHPPLQVSLATTQINSGFLWTGGVVVLVHLLSRAI